MLDNLIFHNHKFIPDVAKVIAQFCDFGDVDRKQRLIARITSLTDKEVDARIEQVFHNFSDRHDHFEQILEKHFDRIAKIIPEVAKLPANRRLLIGAIFTNEYAYEAAAYMNPSLVLSSPKINPAATEGSCIMSIRSVGEGHISSIAFKELEIARDGQIIPGENVSKSVLPDFIRDYENYTEIRFDPATKIPGRVIFPVSAEERNGMEDARFVAFEDGRYFATYTAYDGKNIDIKLLETEDFCKILLHRLHGSAVQNKGLALFPKMIAGKYAMIGRLDGENLFFLDSDNPFKWETFIRIDYPLGPWETVQIGNCGSPLATAAGWLLLTHGVSSMRTYYISACLLDHKKPWQVIARLREPLIDPFETSREGYVPNVVYSCGGSIINETLFVPFAVADYYTMIASIPVRELLNAMHYI